MKKAVLVSITDDVKPSSNVFTSYIKMYMFTIGMDIPYS